MASVHRPPPQSARQEPGQPPALPSPDARASSSGRSTRRSRAHHHRRRQGRRGFDPDRRHRRAAIPSLARQRRATSASCPATRNSSPATGSRNPRAAAAAAGGREASDSGARRGRLLLRAERRRISRHPVRGSRASRSRQGLAEGCQRSANSGGPATPTTARRPISPCCARCAQHEPTSGAAAADRRPRSSGSRRSSNALRAKDPRRSSPTGCASPKLFGEIERLKRLQRADSLHRSDRRSLQSLRADDRSARQGGHVLPDGRLGLDGRAREGPRQALLHPLHLFLKRKYERVDIVFIRHTHEAAEVDEQEFFYGRETGGTVVSSALEDNDRGAREALSRRRLERLLRPGLRRRQFGQRHGRLRRAARARRFCRSPNITPISRSPTKATAELRRPRDKDLWRGYAEAQGRRPISPWRGSAGRADIYPVFRKLFARQNRKGAASNDRRVAETRRERARRRHFCSTAPTGTSLRCRRVYEAIEVIALEELGLDVFPNQIEIISAEQMLDAYSSVGMPLMYSHWSYGKRFVRDEVALSQGLSGARLRDRHQFQSLHQLLHGGEHDGDADAGHRARRLRPQPLLQEQLSLPAWTDPTGILDYLDFAKRYVAGARSATASRRSRRRSTRRMR